MRRNPVKANSSTDGPSRRELLEAVGAAALGLLSASPSFGQEVPFRPLSGDATKETNAAPSATTDTHKPWWIEAEQGRSRIVEVRSARVMHGSAVEPHVLGEMIDQTVQQQQRASSAEAAWRSILKDAPKIAIKFNSVGAEAIGTTEAFAKVLVERLEAAGIRPDRIALIEAGEALRERLGTRAPAMGWGAKIAVGDGKESLANWLLEADAVINVPFLKTHQIAGMSGCMKNISHAVIRRPGRYHANGCSPYVGQVIGSSEVSRRLKLHLVNALRIVVDRGPDAGDDDVANWSGVLAGVDPIALDFVGRSILETERRERKLPVDVAVPYLLQAADAGLGRWRPADLDRVVAKVDPA